MIAEVTAQFYLDPSIVMFNHASYGLATRRLMDEAEQQRRRIERDPLTALGDVLQEQLRTSADLIGALIGAEPGSIGLVANATEASAALAASLLRGRPIRVLTLSTEYSAVLRAWSVRVQTSGGRVEVVDLPLPLVDAAMVIAYLEAVVDDQFDVLVVSMVSSSTAVVIPVRELARWARRRGMTVIVDAAHVVGHVSLDVGTLGADAVFGTLHKWLPVPRPAGFLWLAPSLRSQIRPAVIGLNWDDGDLSTRFGWRGTWDPAPMLCLGSAIDTVDEWRSSGLIEEAVAVAGEATGMLVDLGLVPTAAPALVAPRLRGFIVADTPRDRLEQALLAAGVRASVGRLGSRTLLRISPHVYTSTADVEVLSAAVAGALPG